MRGGIDKIIVRADRRMEDGTGVMGHDGQELVIDTRFKPNHHKRIFGEVVALPSRMSEDKIFVQFGYAPIRHKHYSDVVMDIQVGDKVYFSYLCLSDEWCVGTDDDGKELFVIDLMEIFCVVRRGFAFDLKYYDNAHDIALFRHYVRTMSVVEAGIRTTNIEGGVEELEPTILMFGGYMLVEKLYEEGVTINEHGVAEKRSAGGIILLELNHKQQSVLVAEDPDDENDYEQNKSAWFKYEVKPMQGKGKVVNVGTPLKGLPRQIQTGDLVHFHPRYQFENNIEGTNYWLMRQTDIDAIER